MRPCKGDVVAVARAACLARRRGATTYTQNGITFDLVTGGWCAQFVRQVCAVAERLYDPGFSEYSFPWLWYYAADVCRALEQGGYRTDHPEPGDILGMSPGYRLPGHLGIYLGSQVAENTNNPLRGGPGTVLSPISSVQHMITGYYALYPSRTVASPARDLAIVGLAGEPVVCHPVEERRATRVDLRPLAEALGLDCIYRTYDDGRQRIYLKAKA